MNLNEENTQERNRQDTLMEMLTRARLDLEKYGLVMENASLMAEPVVEASLDYYYNQTFGATLGREGEARGLVRGGG